MHCFNVTKCLIMQLLPTSCKKEKYTNYMRVKKNNNNYKINAADISNTFSIELVILLVKERKKIINGNSVTFVHVTMHKII